MKLSKIKFNLDVFNVLLNPKGSISNKDFLIGITTLFIYVFHQILNQKILQNILNVSYRINDDIKTITAINITPNIFSLPSISLFLIFVICIILSYKRAVDLNLKVSLGIVIGIIIYSGFYFTFFNSFSLVGFYSYKDVNVIKNTEIYMGLYNLLSSLALLITIGLIIYLSLRKGKKEKIINKKTTKYILSLGKVNLLLIVFMLVLTLMYFLLKIDINIISIIGIVIIVVALIYYLYLNYMQSKNFRFLFYFNLTMFIIIFSSYIGIFFLMKNIDNILIIKICLSLLSIFNMLFLVSNLGFISIETAEKT